MILQHIAQVIVSTWHRTRKETEKHNHRFSGVSASDVANVALAAGAVAAAVSVANATPVWELDNQIITGSYVPEEWDGTPLQGTQARRFEYHISNNSDDGESLKELTLPIGTDDNIMHMWYKNDYLNSDWLLELDAASTKLTSDQNNLIAGDTGVFKLLTTDLDPEGDYLRLASKLDKFNDIFNPFVYESSPGVFDEGLSLTLPGKPIPSPDHDGDGMIDTFEQIIIDADLTDSIETIDDVLPEDDFDRDQTNNAAEEILGYNPTDPAESFNLTVVFVNPLIGQAALRYSEILPGIVYQLVWSTDPALPKESWTHVPELDRTPCR